MKKVLGLIASHRKGGNSELAVREMMRRFPDDWEKGMIRLTDLDIAYCRACYACLPKGRGCVIEDDMAFLIEQIREADKIILASATYIQGGHTALKRMRDRTLPLIADFEDFAGKDCVLVGSYGIRHWDGLLQGTPAPDSPAVFATISDDDDNASAAGVEAHVKMNGRKTLVTAPNRIINRNRSVNDAIAASIESGSAMFPPDMPKETGKTPLPQNTNISLVIAAIITI